MFSTRITSNGNKQKTENANIYPGREGKLEVFFQRAEGKGDQGWVAQKDHG